MIRIEEIVAFNRGLLAIIFTDVQSGEKDMTLFKYHATAEDLDALKVWQPKPDDAVMTICLEEETERLMERWAYKRGLTIEQMARAFVTYIARYGVDVK